MVTGTRAEYGLLRLVLDGLRTAEGVELQLLVTGAHLEPRFGLTVGEIEQDGFRIDARVPMQLESDTPQGVARSMGLALSGASDAFARHRPDVVVVLGDRFEIFAVAAAAMLAGIPIAHIHGGETTEGAFDEAIRHSVTKMSHLHFVAAEEYRQRVIQLGEDPARVFLVGGLGVDAIRRIPLLERAALEASLGIALGTRNLLVTFHPVTLEPATAGRQLGELLAALNLLPETQLIFTMPNADTGSHVLIDMIERFVATHPNAAAFTSLGHHRYLSLLQFVDGVVGNSSSGLTEAPSFRIGTVNIGDRQKGRLRAESVIDCEPDRQAIGRAIARLYAPEFREACRTVRNPYGDGGASERIVEVLRVHPLAGVLKKRFHDIRVTTA